VTEINLGVFRAAGHRLVDRIVNEFEALIREELPEVFPQHAPVKVKAKTRAVRRRGARGPDSRVGLSVSIANGYPLLNVNVPRSVADQAGLKAGLCAHAEVSGPLLFVTPSSTGPKVRDGSGRLHLLFSGHALGLPKKTRPSSYPAWIVHDGRSLEMVLPSWWPAAPNPTGRVRTAAPGGRIDGGELIPVADRDFFCHTCEVAVATITCDTCNGLYCAGCWSSHLLTHRRPGSATRREEVARA
jgi:hypothetical protein